MKTIIVADIRSNVVNGRISGHIVPVARNYLEVLGSDFDVKIAAGPAILNSFGKNDCIVLPYNVCSKSAKDKVKIFINFLVLLWKARGKVIILQQASVSTSFIAIALFFWWSSKIYQIQYNTDALNSTAKRIIHKLAKRKITGTICPSERIGKAYGSSYCVVPDYLFSNQHIEILPFSERTWDVGIIGGITANKGVVEAAETLSKTDYKVLIAGRICEPGLEESLKWIASKGSNIDLRLGFLSDDDYCKFIHTSKYCILNYKGTYFDRSSGVVLDVLYNGTPVVGTRCEALNLVERSGTGCLYDDIREVKWESLFAENQYNMYLDSIRTFLDSQDGFVAKLKSYIGTR